MFKMTEFAKRRKQLMQKIGPNGIVILASAPTVIRNHDCDYPYRQKSDFYYLTGFEESESILMLLPKRKKGEFILFNRPKDRANEIWEGFRAGQLGACKDFYADESFSIHEFQEKLPDLLAGRKAIHYSLGLDTALDQILLETINKIRKKIRSGIHLAPTFMDIESSLHEMRLIKSPTEIAMMKKAAKITAAAHIRAMQYCRPGMNEYQLEAEISYEFQRNGARSHAYTPIVGSGANTCILHYVKNDRVIKNGDLVLIDAGCEYSNYAADVTRTFPANGRFTAEQRAIYDIVLEAQLAGIKAVRPGAAFSTYHDTIVKIITQGLMDLKILKGSLQALIEKRAYFPFYMHKSGHWLGLDVHDAGYYNVGGRWRTLNPGMVLTVEPGIYISADTPGVAKRWHNIGIRIEDDLLVTRKGNEVLSEAAPKTINDIETLMNAT